jgi:hypothetical protein
MGKPVDSSAERKARGKKPYNAPTQKTHSRSGFDLSYKNQHNILYGTDTKEPDRAE